MRYSRHTVRWGVLASVLSLGGCTPGPGSAWFVGPRPTSAPATVTRPVIASVFPAAAGDLAGSSGPRPILLQVRFDVLRACVPVGEVSRSGKIWNHVDEDVVPADWAAHLRRNGIRVGRGTSSSWAPIRAILEAARGTRCQPESLITRGSGPLILQISARPRDQTLFLYRPDGGLVGATFAASTNVIRIEYGVPPTELDSVALSITPEVRQQDIDAGWRVTPHGVIRNPTEAARALRELAFDAIVPPDHFILIGPSPQVDRQLLAGRALLVDTIDGQEFESLFFITPRVFRAGTPPAATQPAGG